MPSKLRTGYKGKPGPVTVTRFDAQGNVVEEHTLTVTQASDMNAVLQGFRNMGEEERIELLKALSV